MPSATEDTDSSAEAPPQAIRDWSNTSVSRQANKTMIMDEQDAISPLMLAKSKEVDEIDLDSRARNYNAILARRISSRKSSVSSSPTTWHPHARQLAKSRRESPGLGNAHNGGDSDAHQTEHHHGVSAVIDEVVAWLQTEKAKKRARRTKRKAARKQAREAATAEFDEMRRGSDPSRRESDASDDASLDLERLESILEKGLASNHTSSSLPSRRSSRALKRYGSRSSQTLRRHSTYRSSDTECYEDDVLVPSCDAVLDNSGTLYTSDDPGAAAQTMDLSYPNVDLMPLGNETVWPVFKYEIMRLAHTLKLKGWRQLPLSNSDEISVERLSGALTNAVYVVSPPDEMPEIAKGGSNKGSAATRKKKPPLKLILRIYGPEVEHLIDRNSELQILRRLARKNIGPRLLGTFRNGRFEEFLRAQTLRPQDLRAPDTSKQIAKRMRELHDGIELLGEERIGGPYVWKNWDKWVDRAEKRATQVDAMVERRKNGAPGVAWGSKLDGYVCGTRWAVFRQTVDRYRKLLDAQYGSKGKLMDQLVFAHNDTQYGNIMRLEPPGESPLLLPANKHKQLVVIDFEYANANVPGYEFANHFTEWCYNYHDPETSFKCNTAHYPSPEEQHRFIRAYIDHRPTYAPAAPSTPRFTPLQLSRSVSSLDLNTRGQNPVETEGPVLPSRSTDDLETTAEIQRLLHETRIWRVANSAQWVAWGILQAKIPDEAGDGGDQPKENIERCESPAGEEPALKKVEGGVEQSQEQGTNRKAVSGEVNNDEGFDCLSYARDRALFFWGDCLQLGLVARSDLEEEVYENVKIVPH